jgi:uncharacterized membrane protein
MSNSKAFRIVSFSTSGTMHQWLLLSSAFSCLLVIARVLVTGSLTYLFLPWNLFLAFIPYWITSWMMRQISILENKIKLIAALGLWLLFIPNSFYIITDLFHLTQFHSAPRWFDLLLIFSFAWNGILCGVISLRRVETIVTVMKGKGISLLLVLCVSWLSAFGVYIGRFLRFNSWDVITNPFSLANEIVDMVMHPFENGYAWGMTLCYAAFTTLIYFTLKKLSESFIAVQ